MTVATAGKGMKDPLRVTVTLQSQGLQSWCVQSNLFTGYEWVVCFSLHDSWAEALLAYFSQGPLHGAVEFKETKKGH